MPDIAYLIGHPEPLKFSPDVRNNIPFSRLQETLRREGYDLPAPIKHTLLDMKIPLKQFFQLFPGVFPPFESTDPDFFQGINSTRPRYRTIPISDQLIMWGILGYSFEADRKKALSQSVKAYTAKGEYEDPLKGKWKWLGPIRPEGYFSPPYFALTSLDAVSEVKEAFEGLGIEVHLVDVPNSRKNLVIQANAPLPIVKSQTKPQYTEMSKPAFDGVTAQRIRRGEKLTQQGLAELLGYEKIRGFQISNFETEVDTPGFPPQSEFVKSYLNWLMEHGYNPFGFKTTEPEHRDLPSPKLRDVERQMLLDSMTRHNGNKRLVAEELGVSLKTVYNRLNKLDKEKC